MRFAIPAHTNLLFSITFVISYGKQKAYAKSDQCDYDERMKLGEENTKRGMRDAGAVLLKRVSNLSKAIALYRYLCNQALTVLGQGLSIYLSVASCNQQLHS